MRGVVHGGDYFYLFCCGSVAEMNVVSGAISAMNGLRLSPFAYIPPLLFFFAMTSRV